MQVSRIKVNPSLTSYKELPSQKKARLRKEKIKQLILSKPAGTPIATPEFERVTGLVNSAAWRVVDQMAKDGEIIKSPVDGPKRAYSYSVNDAKLKGFIVPAPSKVETPSVATKTTTKTSEPTLQEKAKVFAWLTGSDSLSQFITWHDERN